MNPHPETPLYQLCYQALNLLSIYQSSIALPVGASVPPATAFRVSTRLTVSARTNVDEEGTKILAYSYVATKPNKATAYPHHGQFSSVAITPPVALTMIFRPSFFESQSNRC
ncbi:hypothetical protein K438DRAFT_1682220, partial [Mycena galopus ATCC 62051]